MRYELLGQAIFIFQGILITLKYSVVSVFLGLIIGIILSLLKISNNRLLRLFANLYVSIFRGTPLLIQLSLIYFAVPQLFNIKLGVFISGIIAFSMNSGAYVSEIIRSGIESVDKGQIEASKVLGIPKYYMIKDIIIPQAIRNILPALVNELINLLKESAIISFFGEYDIMRRAQIIATREYTYFAPMLIAACSYYIMVMVLTYIASIIERRMKL